MVDGDRAGVGHDGAVAQVASDVGHHGGGHREQRGPGGRGDTCYEYLAGPHQGEILGPAQHADGSADLSRAGAGALDDVAGLML